ncbi:hypothetical protein EB118_12215 [bacterium]|nr:hypothetical protein [bacterium]NDD84928.1 hypothetical protein [bacterium]NDG30822.1 hypothetical protein [bacterium]
MSTSDDTSSFTESTAELVNIEDVIDIYDYFKETFTYCPEFLGKLYSTDLTNFLEDVVSNCVTQPPVNIDKFINQFSNELELSYTCVNGYLKKVCNTNVTPGEWAAFCKEYTIHLKYT